MSLAGRFRRFGGSVVERAFLFAFEESWMQGPEFPENIGGRRVMLQSLWRQKVLGFNRNAPVPVDVSVHVADFDNLKIPADRGLDNLRSPGCYFQNFAATITWGNGVYIGPNVGIITANHSLSELNSHDQAKPVDIGDNCWIGMGAVLLPGVALGPSTVVGAGAIVTRPFPEGFQVLAGNPARVVGQVPRLLPEPGVGALDPQRATPEADRSGAESETS